MNEASGNVSPRAARCGPRPATVFLAGRVTGAATAFGVVVACQNQLGLCSVQNSSWSDSNTVLCLPLRRVREVCGCVLGVCLTATGRVVCRAQEGS